MKLWKVNAEVNKQTQVQETKDDQRTFGIGWPNYQFFRQLQGPFK